MLRQLLLAAAMLLANRAAAAPITLYFQAAGAGTLNGSAFVTPSFTIVAQADTANRQFIEDVFVLDHDVAQIVIDGVGVFSFTSGTRTVLSPGGELVGFGREFTGEFTSGDLIYTPFNSALGAWDMKSSFSTITGPGTIFQWADDPPVVTDGGVLALADATTPVTFHAIVTPEPPLAGLLLGSVAIVAPARRKLKHVAGVRPKVE